MCLRYPLSGEYKTFHVDETGDTRKMEREPGECAYVMNSFANGFLLSILKHHRTSLAELRSSLIAFREINPWAYHNETAFFEIWVMVRRRGFRHLFRFFLPLSAEQQLSSLEMSEAPSEFY